jgi:hypothetical protein
MHYISLAESDAASKYLTEASSAGMSILTDRVKTAHMGASGATAVAMANRSSKMSSIWGLFSAGHKTIAGGGAGVGSVARTRPSNARSISERAEKSIIQAEAQRPLLDPIEKSVSRLRLAN